MANRSFNSVFLLIVAGVCAFLDVVLLENPPPAPILITYRKESPNLDFGIKMTYDSTKDKTMTVVISYDTETESASTFFGNPRLSGWIDGFTACNVINFKFRPCTVSKLDQSRGQLLCASNKQCTYDKIHSCIAIAFEENQILMGKFLICFFSGYTATECAKRGGLDEQDMEKCITNGHGALNCDIFHKLFLASIGKIILSEVEKNGDIPNAITDFKTATCRVLALGNLQCPSVCSQP